MTICAARFRAFLPSQTPLVLQWEPESTPDWEEPAWSHGEEDFDEVREYETADESDWEEADESHGPKDTSFLGALSMEEPGLADVVITPELLASIENSLDLSGYGISTLEGLRHCTGLVSLTLSANDIDDLEELRPLSRLEELFLSENRIEDIDPLSDLHSLREADLSFNQIRDITPLLGLSGLKLVNLVGNPVSQEQTRSLEERGVMVVV
ncbi:MAG: leucine-rich repeat protein [Spirochaetia bacterium]|nr:leucine-rich repeat protein [Spirochaetia bacterium]